MKPTTMSHGPYISRSLGDTKRFAEDFLSDLVRSESGAIITALSGDLGSGKTAFAKEVGMLLGIQKENITSPTFVIEKIYKLNKDFNKKGFSHLIHIDAYRIEDSKEMLTLGWEEVIQDNGNLILVEWPEKINSIMPKNIKTIRFAFIDENTRSMEYMP